MDRDADDLKRDDRPSALRLHDLLQGTDEHKEHDVNYTETVKTTGEEISDELTSRLRCKADAFLKCYIKCNSGATSEDRGARRKWFQNIEVRVADTIVTSKIYQHQRLRICQEQDVLIWLGKTGDELVLILTKSARREFILMKYFPDELEPYIGLPSMMLKDLISNILNAQELHTLMEFLKDAPDTILPDLSDDDDDSTPSPLAICDTQPANTQLKIEGNAANANGQLPTTNALLADHQRDLQSGQNGSKKTTATTFVPNSIPPSRSGHTTTISPPISTPSAATGGLFRNTAPNIGSSNTSSYDSGPRPLFGSTPSIPSNSASTEPTSAAIPSNNSSGGSSLFAFKPNSSVTGVQPPSVPSNTLFGGSSAVASLSNASGGLFGTPASNTVGGSVNSNTPNSSGGLFGSSGYCKPPKPAPVGGQPFPASTSTANSTYGFTGRHGTAQSTTTSKKASSFGSGLGSQVIQTSGAVTNSVSSSSHVTSPWPTQKAVLRLHKGYCCDPKLILPMGPAPQSDGFYAEKEPNSDTVTSVFKTITHHPAYERWSLEELRLTHYQ